VNFKWSLLLPISIWNMPYPSYTISTTPKLGCEAKVNLKG
jgi:hypothetical protein